MKLMYVLSDDIGHNTSANIRNAGLIKGFVEKGVSVQVVCLKASSCQDQGLLGMIKGADLLYFTRQSQGAVNVNNQNLSFKAKIKRKLVKLYNIFRVFDPNIYLIRRMNIDTSQLIMPDVILSSSDPRSAHVLARKVAKALDFNGKLIQYWGDPMCNDISASRLMRPILKMRERELVRTADLSLYTNQASCDKISKLYHIPSEKLMAIPTPCESSYSSVKHTDNRIINIGYFGEYYSWRRNMTPLFSFIYNNPEYQLTIAGKTDVSVAGKNFDVHPVLPSSEVNTLMEQMDVLVVVENLPKKGYEKDCIQIPGKVFHYGATDKKILVISETGLTRNEFVRYNRYKFCDNNVESIGKALSELIQDNEVEMQNPVADFSPMNVANRIINWYEHELQG